MSCAVWLLLAALLAVAVHGMEVMCMDDEEESIVCEENCHNDPMRGRTVCDCYDPYCCSVANGDATDYGCCCSTDDQVRGSVQYDLMIAGILLGVVAVSAGAFYGYKRVLERRMS